ncbi:flagellar hook-length control protein FliK [Marinomonas sp.]|uniref:flagellar hook-length control protein FliK n=1 Tax=Marinomonas sp. TaxID=1904862 RepID=UPI003BAC037D
MRTDSNTILSLPSGVPPRKPTFAKAAPSHGSAFADDFRKAKEVSRPSKRPEADTSSASTSSAKDSAKAAENTPSSTKAADKKVASVNNNETVKDKSGSATTESSPVASDDNTSTQKTTEQSGKGLQQEGEALPAEESSVVALNKGEALPAEESSVTALNEGEALPVEEPSIVGLGEGNALVMEETSAISQNKAINSSSLEIDGVSSKNAELSPTSKELVGDGKIATELSDNKTDSKVAGVSVLAGLDAFKRGASSEAGKVSESSKLTALSGDHLSNEEKELSSEEGDLEGDGDNELSWVLSQMGAAGVKSATANPSGDAVLDTTKAAVATAGVIAGASDKQSRQDTVPSSLLDGTSSSEDLGSDSADSLLGEDGIFIDEPIELRKKEHEAMLGRMSAQADGHIGADNSPGGLNSSLHNNVNRAAALSATAIASNAVPNSTANLAMTLPPGHPGWAGEMSQKVAWIARDGGHTAHIRLDPPELGSLTVKVSVDSDSNTQISFVAATPQARDLLEGQMGRLREMLAQQGMDLSRADVDVSQQDTSGAQDRANNRNNGVPQGAVVDSDDVEDDLISSNLSYVSASGVDYYA